jgi:hypothetical protein
VKAFRRVLSAFPIRTKKQISDLVDLPKLIGLSKAVAEVFDVKPILEVQEYDRVRRDSRIYYIYCRILGKISATSGRY